MIWVLGSPSPYIRLLCHYESNAESAFHDDWVSGRGNARSIVPYMYYAYNASIKCKKLYEIIS